MLTDEEMPDATEPPEETTTVDQPPPKQPELKEEVTVQGGRRRGKRQVMKKKMIKDEEGYLGECALYIFSLQCLYAKPAILTDPGSDCGGADMGILLGRRTGAEEEAGEQHQQHEHRRQREGRGQGRTGQYHVILLEEVV